MGKRRSAVENRRLNNEESDFSNKSRNDTDLQCRRRISAGYCITGWCVVTQIKTVDNDGYSAVQVGFVDKKEKTVNKDANGKKEIRNRHGVNKAQMGHFAKAGVSGKRFVREFKFENADEYKLADEIKADIFAEGDKVDVTAISKGKGFQGAIKRLGQHRHRWLMVLSSIVIRVLTVHVLLRAVYSREKECLDTWVA